MKGGHKSTQLKGVISKLCARGIFLSLSKNRTVPIFLLLLLLLSPKATALVYYDFDADAEVGGSYGWVAEEWTDDAPTDDTVPTLSRDTTSGNGLPETGSLKIACSLTAAEYYKFGIKDGSLVDGQDVRRLPYYRVAIKAPNVTVTIEVKLFVSSSSYNNWEKQYSTQVVLTNNTWNLVSYDLSSLPSTLLADLDEWGIEFELDSGLTGDIYVDTVEINYLKNASCEKAGFPSVASSKTTNGTTLGTGVSLNMPSGITAGDLLIAFASNDNTGGTAMGISGWTQLFFTQYTGNVVSHGAWAKIAVGSDTATLTGAAQDYAAIVVRITGHGVSTISTDIEVGTTASTSGANPDPPSLDAGFSQNWLWLESFGADDDDNTATYWSTNYTGVAQIKSTTTTTTTMCSLAYYQLTAQTEDPGIMAMAASEEALAQTIAIPPPTWHIEGMTEYDSDGTAGAGRGGQSSDYARTGSYSAKITVYNSAGWYHGFYQDMPSGSVSAGDVIFASVYIYTPASGGLSGDARAFLKIEWKDSGNSDLGSSVSSNYCSSSSQTGAWVEYAIYGTAPASTDHARIVYLAEVPALGTGTGDVYFDDPYLHRPQTANISKGSCTLANAGFESGSFDSWGSWGTEGSKVTGFSRSGNACLKIACDATASSTGYYQEAYSGTALVLGARVTATGYMYCSTDDAPTASEYGIVKVEIRNSSGTYNRPTEVTLTSSNSDWRRYRTETDVNADDVSGGASVIRVICQTWEPNAGATATFYFDDINVYYEEAPPVTARNVPNLSDAGYTSSPGMEMKFESTKGGMVTSYYDYAAGKGTQQIVSGGTDLRKLFKFLWHMPGNWYGLDQEKAADFILLEETPSRIRFKVESKHWYNEPDGNKIVTNYVIYPNKTFYVRTDFTSLAYQYGYGGPYSDTAGAPGTLYLGFYEDYDGYQTSYYLEDDANDTAGLTPDADGHDGALILHHDLGDFDDINPSYDSGSGGDSIGIEYVTNAATPDSFLYNTTETHYWHLDFSESYYDSTLMGKKRDDYRTHSATYITMNTGTLLSGSSAINDDADQDGFDEGAGTWNISYGSNGVSFELESGSTYSRYAPAFFFTNYKDSATSASSDYVTASKPYKIYQDTTLLTEGESYNIDFINFSEVWSGAVNSTTSITSNANDASSDATLFSAQNDCLFVGSPYKFQGILVDLDTNGSVTIGTTYWVEPVEDDCESSSDWTADTNVTLSDDTDEKVGTYSMKMAVAAGYTTGNIAYSNTPNNEDWSSYSGIVFWIKTTVACEDMDAENNSDLRLVVSNADSLASEDAIADLPPIPANTWTEVHLKIDLSSCNSVDSFGFKLREDNGAQDIYVDDIKTGYWKTLTVTDGTSGFTQDGMIYFTEPTDWAKVQSNQMVTGMNGIGIAAIIPNDFYFVRIKATAVTTAPVENKIVSNLLIFQYFGKVSTDNFLFEMTGATLVSLTEFTAIGYFDKVKLFWKTEAELDNLGFNILRSEDGKNYVKINPELIKALGTPAMGSEYTYEDADVENGKTYYYLLEDVETSGVTTRHGPVIAHPGRDFDGDGMTDDWEYYYGLPATVYDAEVDSDDDGLTNIEEFLAGTNPFVIDSENAALSSQDSGVKVVEAAGLRAVLELNTTTFKVTNKNIDGVIYHVITLPEYTHGQTTDEGKPQLPTKGVLFGTLSKKPVTINVLETEKETYTGYNVYPVPKAVFVEDPNDPDIKRLTYEFYKDTNAYSVNAFYPSTLAEVDYSNYLQDQQVIKVIFHPVRFNPVKGSLEFYKRIRVEIIQEGAEQVVSSSEVTPKAALPLTEDNAHKIYITEDGIYRLTKSYLESQGISLAGVDPTRLKIYNQGSEIPLYVFGEEDGEFGATDYIEFYAQAMDTRYTGTNVYWLVLSDSSGLRMATSAQDESATTTPGSFLDTIRKEDTTLYWMESKGEDHWFIDAIYGSQVYNLALNLNDVANTTNEATVRIAVEGSIYSGGAFAHHLYARLNGYPIADITWKGNNEYIITTKVSHSYLKEGENTVTLEVGEDYTGYEEILINWVEVSYWRKFVAKDNLLAFGNLTDGAYLYKISGFTTQDVAIYDVTQPNSVQRITQFTVLPDGDTFTISFKDIGNKRYIILAKDKAELPYGVSLDEPSTLADKKNRADYIIITHPDFYDMILPFAEYRSKQGLKVKVVKLDDIYDEFDYGIADVQAIKDFLKYAYYNWTAPKPSYVLLVGDATFDYRDYSGYGFTNYVPTYLVHSLTFGETGSDNWFVCFDGENDVIPDMLIGRFPVKTTDELQTMINKIKNYESASPDEGWTKKVLLVADDKEKIFEDTSEKVASYLTKGYTADKQYLGVTTSRPDVLRQNIVNSINEGRLFVNYAGHGGIGLWANERIFTWNDINYLYNQHTLPIFTTLTCANGYFVYPRYIESLGERLINAPSGGAVACLVPSGISYPTTQAYLAEGFYGAYFNDGDAILGSMVARGKLSVYENESGSDAINVIQTYNLFGDPALKVRIKAPQIPAVAAPEVFNLDNGKVNKIFRLTEETASATTSEGTGTVIVSTKAEKKDKGSVKKGLTKIIHEEEAPTSPSPAKGLSDEKASENKGLDIEDIQLEDKTVALAPPKWKVLSKAGSETLKVAKPFVKIDYGTIEQNVTNINRDARQLAELRTKFDEAIKEADLQKAKVILRVITKLARKIYWRKF